MKWYYRLQLNGLWFDFIRVCTTIKDILLLSAVYKIL